MNLSAIYSKTGKGVQEASGKTSHLSRADRSVLAAIDGKTPLSDVLTKFEKLTEPKFEALIQQLDKDGFIREVSSGASQPAAHVARSVPPPRGAPPKAPAGPTGDDGGEALDFTSLIPPSPKTAGPTPPKGPALDLAAAARAEAERKAKEQEAFDYKARAEAEAKAKAEAEARARAAAAEARARAEAEARARATAEADAKVKAAREAAIRLATEAKAKGEAAEERARKQAEETARLESELNAKLAEERKAREEAERRAQEAAELARKELEEKAQRDAEELRKRLEAEMKAKLEEERKAREAEDRKRREEEERRRAEEDRKRREEDERRRKEDEERRAKAEAERKAREEEDRKRREEDERRRKEDAERRAKEEAERKARKEEEERRAKEETERRRKDEERRAKEEAERKARREEEERREREERDSKRRKEEEERRAREEAERRAKDEAGAKERAAPAAAAPAGGDIGDSLLADLDSFSKREEDEAREKEEAERKAKEEAARRAKEEAERKAREDAERKRREDDERRRKEEDERRAREEAERQAREEEERAKQEEAERKRKAKESLAAKQAGEKAARAGGAKPSAGGDDDIGVTDEDLDMDDIKRDQKVLAKAAQKAPPEYAPPPPVGTKTVRRPMRWGKPAAIALFVLLVGGIGLLNVMPVSVGEYEKAASETMGVPVKIASARLAVLTGVEVKFEGVSIGDGVKIRLARGSLALGSLFGGKKAFSKMELEGAAISQAQLGDAVLGKVSGENFRIDRIVIKQAKFDGPLALPPLDVEALVGSDGMLQLVTASGGDKLVARLSPNGGNIGFEISAGGVAVPFVPALTLSEFGWKGTANRSGVSASEFDGRVYDGVLSGTAKIRWGASWTVEGDVRARSMKIAVFAPALVSEGKVEGQGTYSMSGADPAKLFESARMQGDFKIDKGVLGSFNLTRALQTGGAQSSGRTEFSELTGHAVYDKGAIQVRNVAITAGAMNAGASLDIDAQGALSGRVAADVKTPNQTLRATLNVSGKITDPVVRK